MMQGTETGVVVRQALVVDEGLAKTTSAAARSVRALVSELQARDIHVIEALSCEDGLAIAVSDAGIHCILLNWTQGDNDAGSHEQATDLLRAVRARNANVPIFLMASRKLAGTVSVEVATLADEFIWILDDTARIHRRPCAGRDRALRPGLAAAVRGRARALRPRARVLVGRAGPPGRRRVPEVPGRPRVLRFLRREAVSHGHGHRARRARLAARPQRSDRRERDVRRAQCSARTAPTRC